MEEFIANMITENNKLKTELKKKQAKHAYDQLKIKIHSGELVKLLQYKNELDIMVKKK